ncbi:unnamed protein product [Rotaria sp. Silwood1]|nr:unnamed protein product [Rotaria sp. Silwood1]CAF1470144.1 unnamed protein product [Rotaria sp. Silwood1]CAF3476659.1 unnamed protein product [Rotaria sp. Silwood1]CAF4669477.1 unnamed protein product [Rotaria sp. Silwood1]
MVLELLLYTFFILIIFSLTFIYWKFIRPTKYIYDILRSQGVRSEPFIPIIGQLPELRRYREEGRLLGYHQKLTEKHGLVYLFFLGPYTRLAIQEPDLIADIVGRTSAQNYIKPADLSVRLKPLIGIHNLLVSNGLEHDRARKMLNPAFHFNNLQSMVSIMTYQTTKAIDILLESSSTINLATLFNNLTLSIIASSAFGRSFETVSNARDIIAHVFTEVLAAIAYRASRMIIIIPIISQLPFWRKNIVDQGTRELNNFVDQIITDRRQGRSQSLCAGADILDLLISAIDTQGQPFTDQEIKDQALTFVLAGHETTSNLMAWAMYELMKNPSVYQACQNEVDRVLLNGMIPTYEHLNDLYIIEAVLQETLRLYPPAPFFIRQCINEQIIGCTTNHPLRIPSGTTILINAYAVHRRSEYWSRPNEFDYTRWLRDPITGLKPKLTHPFCYLPFAAGPRNCIGQNFALLEAKVMLAMFVQKCDFELEPGQKIIPEIRITMRPKYGLFAKITKRQ